MVNLYLSGSNFVRAVEPLYNTQNLRQKNNHCFWQWLLTILNVMYINSTAN